MIVSIQANKILGDLYDEYRLNYHLKYPGSNENDCERSFLDSVRVSIITQLLASRMAGKYVEGDPQMLDESIERIREIKSRIDRHA